MDKIIITGGSGGVGRELQKHLDGIYLSSSDYDLTNDIDVMTMYREHNPDIVIHLAAHVGGITDNINNPVEYYEKNVLMNTHVVKYAALSKVKRLIATLSSCAYPDVSDTYPLTEDMLHTSMPNINNIGYGYSKRMLGAHIDIYRKLGYKYSYIIPSNMYGCTNYYNSDKSHFVDALVHKIYHANMNKESSIVIYGDGTPLRQFTHKSDIAYIISELYYRYKHDNMNVSNNENLSIREMVDMALVATNSTHLQVVYDVDKPNGQHRKDIDTSKFKNVFGNYNFISYIDGIRMEYNKLIK